MPSASVLRGGHVTPKGYTHVYARLLYSNLLFSSGSLRSRPQAQSRQARALRASNLLCSRTPGSQKPSALARWETHTNQGRKHTIRPACWGAQATKRADCRAQNSRLLAGEREQIWAGISAPSLGPLRNLCPCGAKALPLPDANFARTPDADWLRALAYKSASD